VRGRCGNDALTGVAGTDVEGRARVLFDGFEDVGQGGVFGVNEELPVDVGDFGRHGWVMDRVGRRGGGRGIGIGSGAGGGAAFIGGLRWRLRWVADAVEAEVLDGARRSAPATAIAKSVRPIENL